MSNFLHKTGGKLGLRSKDLPAFGLNLDFEWQFSEETTVL